MRCRFSSFSGDQFAEESGAAYVHLCEHIMEFEEIVGFICQNRKNADLREQFNGRIHAK